MNRRILRALATLALLALAPGVAAAPADPLADLVGAAGSGPATGDLVEPANTVSFTAVNAIVPAAATTAPTILAPTDILGPTDIPGPAAGAPRTPPTGPPDFRLRATLYHTGAPGVGARDASGCRVVPMRTVAVDRRTIPLHSILFIRETVGLIMPDGSAHDGYWYATDTGGAIRGARIDLFTGANASSMRPLMRVNSSTVSVSRAGTFRGCPTRAGPPSGRESPADMAQK